MTLPLAYDAGFRRRLPTSPLIWIPAAAVLGAVEAVAMLTDVKFGIAVPVALVFAFFVMAKPIYLLPLAMLTVYCESLTFGGAPITRLLAPPALMLVLVEILRGGARIRLSAPLVAGGLYVMWAIGSGLWTTSVPGTQYAIQSLMIALVYLVMFAALPRSEHDVRVFLYVLALAASVMGALSVFAFAGMPSPPHLALTQGGRSQGGVGDPDFFAAMQLVTVPVILVLASETRDKRVRLLLYAGLMCILASIFTSLSRGAFIGIVVLGILFLASRPERLFRSRHEKAIALVVIAVGMVGFFSRPFLRDQVVTRAQSIYAPQNQEDKTGSGRTNIWKAAARTAGEHPFLGVGFGSFRYISEELILNTPGVDLEVYGDREEGDNYAAHQTYLGTAAELGLTGLFLFLGVVLSTILHLRKLSRRALAVGSPFIGRISHALVLGLTTWAMTAFFLSTETARMFWIVVGLSAALPRLIPEPWTADYRRSNAPTS